MRSEPTPSKIEAFRARERERVARQRETVPGYRERQVEAARRWRARQKAEDPEGYRARKRRYRANRRAKRGASA